LRQELDAWLALQSFDEFTRERAVRTWDESADTGDALDRFIDTLAAVDERVALLVEHCAAARTGPAAQPDLGWLIDSRTSPLVSNNARLFYARWLAQNALYDEALEWMSGLKASDVVAPDVLLFYRAIAHHQLVQPDEVGAALDTLLEQESLLPQRYQELARLLRKDIDGLSDDSLDHVARRMADVRRRLSLGHAGDRVQLVERGVMESLDKMIKELEDKAQRQGAQQGQAGGAPAGSPMEDSRIAELKAPGEVDQRDIGDTAGWGDLPAKEREQAMQQIGRDFPAHYRELVEQYFRQLAEESSGTP
jgi:hypothetical protein